MSDKVDEAALRCTYNCGMSHNNETKFDSDALFNDIGKMIGGFNNMLRPVHTNPATRKALGEDI